MKTKLIIAGIKWSCEVPEGLFNQSILGFTGDFVGKEDIRLEIRYSECFDSPEGASITNDILEWYLSGNDYYQYKIIKRDQITDSIIISMKSDKEWSDVVIDIRHGNLEAVQSVNILLTEIAFRNRLHFYEGFVLHSSALEYKGEAIAFSASSGTGKTTHVRLWQENYDVRIINDDHPAVRIINGQPIIYGSPWAGEENKYSNISSRLKGIVILEQGRANTIRKLSSAEVLKELLPRCFLPYYDDTMMKKAIAVFNKLVNNIYVCKLVCRPDAEAASRVKDYFWPDA